MSRREIAARGDSSLGGFHNSLLISDILHKGDNWFLNAEKTLRLIPRDRVINLTSLYVSSDAAQMEPLQLQEKFQHAFAHLLINRDLDIREPTLVSLDVKNAFGVNFTARPVRDIHIGEYSELIRQARKARSALYKAQRKFEDTEIAVKYDFRIQSELRKAQSKLDLAGNWAQHNEKALYEYLFGQGRRMALDVPTVRTIVNHAELFQIKKGDSYRLGLIDRIASNPRIQYALSVLSLSKTNLIQHINDTRILELIDKLASSSVQTGTNARKFVFNLLQSHSELVKVSHIGLIIILALLTACSGGPSAVTSTEGLTPVPTQIPVIVPPTLDPQTANTIETKQNYPSVIARFYPHAQDLLLKNTIHVESQVPTTIYDFTKNRSINTALLKILYKYVDDYLKTTHTYKNYSFSDKTTVDIVVFAYDIRNRIMVIVPDDGTPLFAVPPDSLAATYGGIADDPKLSKWDISFIRVLDVKNAPQKDPTDARRIIVEALNQQWNVGIAGPNLPSDQKTRDQYITYAHESLTNSISVAFQFRIDGVSYADYVKKLTGARFFGQPAIILSEVEYNSLPNLSGIISKVDTKQTVAVLQPNIPKDKQNQRDNRKIMSHAVAYEKRRMRQST